MISTRIFRQLFYDKCQIKLYDTFGYKTILKCSIWFWFSYNIYILNNLIVLIMNNLLRYYTPEPTLYLEYVLKFSVFEYIF